MPDGAYVIGSTYGQDRWQGSNAATEAAIKGQMKTGPLSGFISAQGGFSGIQHIPDLVDGQTELEDRADLLEGVRGYLHLIQGKNWTVSSGAAAKKLPFETQVGPNQGAIKSNNGIRLLEKGLWRADGLLLWEKTTNNGLTGDPNYIYSAQVLAVHRVSDNTLFTRKHCYRTIGGTVDPESVSWSHEFVVPEDNAYDVSIWVAQSSGAGTRRLYGGIQYTGLWVTKIDSRIDNIQPGEGVTEGGPLV